MSDEDKKLNQPNGGQNGDLDEASPEQISEHHKHILDKLHKNEIIDKSTRGNQLTFNVDTDDKTILQIILEKVVDKKQSLKYNEATKDFLDQILRKGDEEFYHGNMSGNGLLDIAAKSNKKDVCLDLLRQLCEMKFCRCKKQPCECECKIYLRWEKLLKSGTDSCLHIAIRAKQVENALYLVQRVKQDGAAEKVLGHQGIDSFTPLRLAVDYEHLTAGQEKLVEKLIEAYPEALFPSTSTPRLPYSYPKKGKPDEKKEKFDEKKNKFDKKGKPDEDKRETGQKKDDKPKPETVPRFRRGKYGGVKNNPDEIKKVANNIRELLWLNCMRHWDQDREKLMRALPTDVGRINLDLTPSETTSMVLLRQLLDFMKFEHILLYVSIPKVRISENDRSGDPKLEDGENFNVGWRQSNRKDCVYIFNWLRSKKCGVKRILRIKVDDSDDAAFHSDEAIEQALSGFEVESWDWKRADICSNVIKKAAPGVRDLKLYWSGNNAVLRSWAAEDGLVQLQNLRSVLIVQGKVIESTQRTERNTAEFKKDFLERWKGMPNYTRDAPLVNLSLDQEEKDVEMAQNEAKNNVHEQKERWVTNTIEFARFLKKYLINHQENKSRVKVAVIDDGVKLDYPRINGNVAGGETFQTSHDGMWSEWYQSSRGHGTLMALLICQICPNAKLYIARLDQKWASGQSQITADSAVKAIEWAQKQKVDIISMSWTIENAGASEQAMQNAISRAERENILLFCASNDQGNQSNKPYPAKFDNTFCIGAATEWGHRDEQTQPMVDYVVPGTYTEKDDLLPDTKDVKGSSIATARCAGLAAVMLQCILYDKGESVMQKVRTYQSMKKIFDRLQENQYIRVSDILKLSLAKIGDYEKNVLQGVSEMVQTYSEVNIRNGN